MEENAGTHFLLRLDTSRSDQALKALAEAHGLSIRFLSDYRSDGASSGFLVFNYACLCTDALPQALATLAALL